MIATADVGAGECLFEIPRNLLLTPHTSRIAQLLQQESSSIHSESGWVPLLLALMYEYTTPTSRWAAYFHLVPDFDELDLPMFWPREEWSSELRGTGVLEVVQKDLTSIDREFHEIVLPFVSKHTDIFTPECRDIEFYKKMVAFVMAYSFTEPVHVPEDEDSDEEGDGSSSQKSPPMMVPMADILNHVAKNNAHLDFGRDFLKMVATSDIKQGEEIFNTYGELPNFELLHMYGFAEAYPENHYDTVDMLHHCVHEELSRGLAGKELHFFEEKWKFLHDFGLVAEDGSFVLGPAGFLTEEEMYHSLKVLSMGEEQFKAHKEKEGWSEGEEDETLDKDALAKLPRTWKEMLIKIAQGCLCKYKNSLEEEARNFVATVWTKLSPRQKYCAHVRYGQLKLLHELISLCSKSR